ncbi:hypothetical protein QT972_32355 [Microcoleus sp. herbarium7]
MFPLLAYVQGAYSRLQVYASTPQLDRRRDSAPYVPEAKRHL